VRLLLEAGGQVLLQLGGAARTQRLQVLTAASQAVPCLGGDVVANLARESLLLLLGRSLAPLRLRRLVPRRL